MRTWDGVSRKIYIHEIKLNRAAKKSNNRKVRSDDGALVEVGPHGVRDEMEEIGERERACVEIGPHAVRDDIIEVDNGALVEVGPHDVRDEMEDIGDRD